MDHRVNTLLKNAGYFNQIEIYPYWTPNLGPEVRFLMFEGAAHKMYGPLDLFLAVFLYSTITTVHDPMQI